MDYKQSGVDIVAGETAVNRIKSLVSKTYNHNVLSGLGSFGGLYQLDLSKWKNPILVSSTDGVGTKILVAQKAKKYNTIGEDLVNHCVNDIFVQGAIQKFFLDYIGIGKLDVDFINDIIEGMTKACIENGLSLIGGEMAEMRDIYKNDDFDLVGTIVGLVEKENLITGENIKENDVVIGFPSTGLHTNGYTLARKIIFDKLSLEIDTFVPEIKSTIGESLLSVHKSYFPILNKWATANFIHGMAHITGGGLRGNIKRIIPKGLMAIIETSNIDIPPLFSWLIDKGEIPMESAFDAFNMGIGFVIITNKKNSESILAETTGFEIGQIKKAENNLSVALNFNRKKHGF